MTRPGGGQDYETPTKQLVVLKGKSCIEKISLPNLQSYYSNIGIEGREYGYF